MSQEKQKQQETAQAPAPAPAAPAVEERKPVTVTSAVILAAVARIVELGESHGEKHSFEYWLEECITMGATAKKRSWEYSDKTRSAKAFTEATAQLDPAAKDFIDQFKALQVKYGVGSTKVELS